MLGDIPKHGAGCFRFCRLANAARKPANGRSRACGELLGAEGIKLGVMPGKAVAGLVGKGGTNHGKADEGTGCGSAGNGQQD